MSSSNNKLETNKHPPQETPYDLNFENNKIKKWVNNIFMNKMDRYAFARGLLIFTFMAFFLGNNLPIFLWIYIATTIYLMTYRIIRFWVKRWLMYMIEFCYVGNFLVMTYIIFFSQSREVFSIAFVCGSGVLTLATIIYNNQAHFNSTDHLTSSYIHVLPLLCVWAIRWKHIIYYGAAASGFGMNLIAIGEINFTNDPYFLKLIYLPFIFWACWALSYLFLTSTILNRFIINDKYGSGVGDFINSRQFESLFGDLKKYSSLKYIIQHFIFFTISLPLTVICYYSFTFNTIYVLLIIVFLAWNTGRNNMRHIQKKLIKKEDIEEVLKAEKTEKEVKSS
jgi:hypothetical protein